MTRIMVFGLGLAGFLTMGGCKSVLTEKGASDQANLQLVSVSQTGYMIVQSAQAPEAETFAAMELAAFIERMSGATLPVVKETEFKGARAIYVGQTDFAKKQKIDFAKLGQEEWIIRAAGENLIISGGRPRGTLYGVYEFLEKIGGIRFLDADTEYVPKKTTLTIPADLTIRAHPAFFRREIYMVEGRQPKQVLFQVRHKINAFDNAARSPGAKYGYGVVFGSPYSTHTHPYYASAFPSNHPEYCAMTEKGNRVAPPPPDCKGAWNGQVCMSNPDVRKFFAAKLRDYIKADRESIIKEGKGEPFPSLYSLVPADNGNKCVCPGCKAAAEKYGAYSGVVLEFINAIADDIAGDYPEISLTTGAYTFYADAPKGIKPRDNVIVYIAQLGAEWSASPKRDPLRSMLHPLNAKPRQMWEEWSKISKTLGVHDYWTAWLQPYQWPHADIHGLAQSLKFYHRCGLAHFFVEDELLGSRIHNFVDLQFYMATRLMQDPGQDEQPIIDEFMALYYGPAAPVMARLLAYIEKRQEDEPGILASVPPAGRKDFDPAFFIETDALLNEAEKLAGDDPKTFARVRQERLAIDETLLFLWTSLNKARPLPFKRDQVLERLRLNYAEVYKKYGGRWGVEKSDGERLAYLQNPPPIPPAFEGKIIIDLDRPELGDGQAKRVADPDSVLGKVWGKAWRLDASMTGPEGQHDQLPVFGLSDCVSDPKFLTKQVIAREKIPADEKYHWYLAGRMTATPTMYFWAHHSWRLAARLVVAYDVRLLEQKTYDVHVSLKLEGPAYVPGSSKTNAFSIDRLILVEVAGLK